MNAACNAHPTQNFLGVSMSALNLAEAVDAVRRAAQGDVWTYVVTPNAAHLARLAKDAELAKIYRQAGFVFLDSRVLALLGCFANLNAPPVVTGADLVATLFAHTIRPYDRVCVIGSDLAGIGLLQRRFGLQDVHVHIPRKGFGQSTTDMAEAAGFAASCGADYTFLVVGSPQQELLAAAIAKCPGARGVGVCAGAAIDFLTGAQRRAPALVRRFALEWAWRLASNPRRLARRYFIESPQALCMVVRSAAQARSRV